MEVNRKILLMLILLLLGWGFIYLGLTISLLGFLAAIGPWLLFILLYYDFRQAQKKWEQEHPKKY